MGTNYYLVGKKCSCCGLRDPEKRRHIGKSSGGWCFSLHVDDPSRNWSDPSEKAVVSDLDGWVGMFSDPAFEIIDEYGDPVSVDKMLSIIRDRKSKRQDQPYGYADWPSFHRANHSEDGPHGLLRHHVDGRYCIGQGTGTWDLCVGEFS